MRSSIAGKSEWDAAASLHAANQKRGVPVTRLAAEAGISRRKAFYLIGLYSTCQEYGIGPAEVEEIGWTKLKEIAPSLTRSNKRSLLAAARKMSVVRLQKFLTGQTGEVALEVFKLNKRQRRDLHHVMLRYGARRTGRGLTNRETALDAMVKKLKALL